MRCSRLWTQEVHVISLGQLTGQVMKALRRRRSGKSFHASRIVAFIRTKDTNKVNQVSLTVRTTRQGGAIHRSLLSR